MERARLSAVLVVALSAAIPPLGLAETAGSLSPGALVRVTAPAQAREPLVGTLVETSAERIVLKQEGKAEPTSIPRGEVRRLEWSPGKRTNGKRGALIGILALSAFSVATAGGEEIDMAILLGAGGGALVGKLVRTRRWQELPVAVSAAPLPGGGAAVSVALAW
jgi:hypothetical protein